MSRADIVYRGKTIAVFVKDGRSVLKILQDRGINIQAPCGGRGTCGKCAVTVVQNGMRKTVLACQTKIFGDCTVEVPNFAGGKIEDEISGNLAFQPQKGYGVAVDIGTTSISLAVYNLENGRLVGKNSRWNRQTAYGGDVITRIKYTMDNPNGLERLTTLVQKQIFDMSAEILDKNKISHDDVTSLAIAGNTVMEHIFSGLDPRSMAAAPYKPKTLFQTGENITYTEFKNAKVFIFPCVSAFVGGDVTSGIYTLEIAESREKTLFIDIGTNGEMALWNGEKFICCSTATGPAFEGAGIACGMPGVDGAICKVKINGSELTFDTVNGKNAVGICGSGTVDIIARLLENGVIDYGGRMLSPQEVETPIKKYMGEDENENGIFYLTEDKKVFFTREDVRKIQLAKAAVAAGIKTVVNSAKLGYNDIDKVIISGGFGKNLSTESLCRIGMIPTEFADKTQYAGNTALSGAVKTLLYPGNRPDIGKIKNMCEYIELSQSKEFTEDYIEQMVFENSEVDL